MKMEKKFEGCETCNVGIYYGLQVSGYYTAYCRSAHLGLDDKLSYKTRSVRLKGSEKYPNWCPEKDEIKGGKNDDRSKQFIDY